jgi:tetratricopeptide (TPR) repeat protein
MMSLLTPALSCRFATGRSIAVAVAATLLAGIVAPAASYADKKGKSDPVAEATAAYDSARFEEAIALLLKAEIEDGKLKGDDLLKANEMLARSYVKLGQNDQARAAFAAILRDHPDWRPDPDKVPPDEIAVFETALDQVKAETAAPPPPPPTETPAVPAPEPARPKGGKSIFKRWWFYAILGGAAAGAAIALSGGGDEEAGGPLPDFPAPPQ